MLLAKLLLISALGFSQASRPAVTTSQYDYEFAGEVSCKLVKLVDMDIYARILFEREEGVQGTGHDINLEYNAYGYILNKLQYRRNLTSYYRQVKGMSLQTIDTSYSILKFLRLGYTLAFEDFSEIKLLGYGLIDFKYLTYELRVNPSTTISKVKLNYEKSKSKGLIPFISFEYINIDGLKDWKQKLGFKYKF